MAEVHVGFMGAGGIARAHAFAIQALKFYYDVVPEVHFESVTSLRKETRENFRHKYGFKTAEDIAKFSGNKNIDTVLIMGPNKVHREHLRIALNMPGVRNIYLEKPACASHKEEQEMLKMMENIPPGIRIQVGFQFLQSPGIREALKLWRSGIFGNPIHFELKYYHGDYLKTDYRKKRTSRLTPAPDGGAMADLGSHGISMLMAFFNNELQLLNAVQAGGFNDVPVGSDLFSSIVLLDPVTKAVGNLSASRISAGTGDWFTFELYAEHGSLKYSSFYPDQYDYFLEYEHKWFSVPVGSKYQPITSFPSGHVPAGWLRSLVHAHYIFLSGDSSGSFVPDLAHGLAVQRIVRETARYLKVFRTKLGKRSLG